MGIPMLERLRLRFDDRLDVWPFTTELHPPAVHPGAIVVAEVWPSMLDIDEAADPIRDAAQVTGTARWLAATDACGGLDALFAPAVESHTAATCVAEEGWVLGVVP